MSREKSFAARVEMGLALVAFWVVFVLIVDVGFRAILSLTDDLGTSRAKPVEDLRFQSAPYADAPYDAEAFFAEMRAARKEAYTPYVVWRSRPFDGEFIHIDDEGNRSTYRAAPSGSGEALRIWLFGGSVIWGLGAPDSLTVSSQLARQIENTWGVDAEVRNLGEIGFVNTQEIVLLIRELQRGRRPDVVVFFDGANDAPAAELWPEVDGTHMNFTSIRDRFEKREKVQPHPALRILHRSGMWRMADAIGKRLGIQRQKPAVVPYTVPKDAAGVRRRGERAAEIWLANRRFVESLARHYGFVPFYLLQPSLEVGAKQRHPSEVSLLADEMKNEAKRVGMEGYAVMREAVRRRLARPEAEQQAVDRRTWDLSDVFADVSDPLYFDYVHVGHDGNRLIAAALADALQLHLCAARSGEIPILTPSVSDRMCGPTKNQPFSPRG